MADRDRSDRMKVLEHRLLAALREAGLQVDEYPSDPEEPNCVISIQARDGERYVGILKAATEARSSVLEGCLATALLRSKALARQFGGKPLALVAAPALSKSLRSQLIAFAERYGDGQPFGLFDGSGKVELRADGLPQHLTLTETEGARGDELKVSRQARDLFSDLNQCMLKVLLAQHLPEALIKAQRGEIRGPTDLGRLAATSPATAHRLLQRLDADGFLARRGGAIELCRIDILFDRWRASRALRPQETWRTRFLLPARDAGARLDEAVRRGGDTAARLLGSGSILSCRALFSACEKLGYGHVGTDLQHLYLVPGPVGRETAFDELGLRLAAEGEAADVVLHEARWPETVFRSAVIKEGVPVADIVQCWLDAVDHPARGAEQAKLVWDRVFVPFLGVESRSTRMATSTLKM